MIIWLNGLFGGGKRTLAANLREAIPGMVIADPEAVGDVPRTALAGHALRPRDYQELPLRRTLTTGPVTALARHTGVPVTAPMTALNPASATEMFTPLRQNGTLLHHLVLHTAPPVLRERIESGWEYPGDVRRSEAVRAHRRRHAAGHHEAAAAWLMRTGT
ncbi:ATP/GTP-binding protein [Streptomyces sp. NPDC051658]|uniref:ATP/GTP-binding protein n=1 Tax=Streptomyces sp. NPDC051658 TaxID=3365667 RepID=UPI003789F3F0